MREFYIRHNYIIVLINGWLRGTVVERRSLTGDKALKLMSGKYCVNLFFFLYACHEP